MQFIKNLWNRFTNWVGSFFNNKAAVQAPVYTTQTVATPAAPAANEVNNEADQAEQQAKADLARRVNALYNTISELAAQRNYSMIETVNAANAQDEATLVRIQRQMKARNYKAPKKAKLNPVPAAA